MGTPQQSIVNNVPFCGGFLHYGDKKNGCANTTKEFEWLGLCCREWMP
jgi:hypothetical protein